MHTHLPCDVEAVANHTVIEVIMLWIPCANTHWHCYEVLVRITELMEIFYERAHDLWPGVRTSERMLSIRTYERSLVIIPGSRYATPAGGELTSNNSLILNTNQVSHPQGALEYLYRECEHREFWRENTSRVREAILVKAHVSNPGHLMERL